MYCSNCGRKNPSDSIFCESCGINLTTINQIELQPTAVLDDLEPQGNNNVEDTEDSDLDENNKILPESDNTEDEQPVQNDNIADTANSRFKNCISGESIASEKYKVENKSSNQHNLNVSNISNISILTGPNDNQEADKSNKYLPFLIIGVLVSALVLGLSLWWFMAA